MPTIETYRKQAKLLVRWHREQNYSLGEWVRKLERFRKATDHDVLTSRFTLTLAQEIVAVDAGYTNWAELKAATAGARKTPRVPSGTPVLKSIAPILFVRDVKASATFFAQKLGFQVEWLHGLPPFFGAVSRDGVRLHLRFVHQPPFAKTAAQEESLICAMIAVSNVHVLFKEFQARGVEFAQPLTKQPWGGTEFHVGDLDGNVISFFTMA
jgi:catechol 2,3-dioxygenase-like lactoylglutathione lyase family enzyme